MIVIVSDSKREVIGRRLYEACKKQGKEVELVYISDRDIKPCYACNGCTDRTYGKCVVRDDMDEILPKMAKADWLVYTHPLTFGGPSYDCKLVLDKSALLGNRFYKARNGEIVKGNIVGWKHMMFLAEKSGASQKEKETYHAYVKEVCKLIDVEPHVHVVGRNVSEQVIEQLAKEVMGQ